MRIKMIDIDDEVAGVLRAAIWDGPNLALTGQLDRKLYQRVDKVLQAIGGKWNRSSRTHQFQLDAKVELQRALDAGGVVDRKRTLELFETPQAIANWMADIAAKVSDAIDRNIRVLEPSAGTGRLLSAFAQNLDTNGQDEVLAIDIDAANCEALRVQGIATQIVCGDFLTMVPQPDKQADVILMNSPFSRNADIRHVSHAYHNWLAPGGILVAIMSPHFTFAQEAEAKAFYGLLSALPGAEVERLPDGSFKGEGTGVGTVLVQMRKAG